ncbi:unnamed protein product [Diabrotica balteata]|uniref:EF-hand domain-containing protein n=1 Tax=Diabrotica balteata TaxID=107213 RepID=A0A9N9XB99_DIABA|nr:unnamed protein product [Diabrotica balteata]
MSLIGLKIAFELLDRNQDGRVTPGEFKIMLNNLGIDIKYEKAEEIIRIASHSGSDLIDQNDFLSFVKQIQKACPGDVDEDIASDLKAAFQVFDLDGDGYITKEELKTAMEMIGEAVTDQQLEQVIRLADTDKDGRINYEEYRHLQRRIKKEIKLAKEKWMREKICQVINIIKKIRRTRLKMVPMFYGENETQHDKILVKVVESARQYGMKLNDEKVQFKVKKVSYVYQIFSESGVKPQAIEQLEKPKNKNKLLTICIRDDKLFN